MRPVLVVCALAGIVGCANEGARRPTQLEIRAVEGGAPTAVSPAVAVARPTASTEPPDAGSPYPPTGEYSVTARVVSDDCRPAYQAPASPWSVVVQAGAERGHAKVNVPLAAVPPSSATATHARSDAVIAPRKPVSGTSVPMPACPSYTRKRTVEVVDASSTRFTIAITVEHGDATACSGLWPSKCTTKVEQTFELARAFCPAECTRGLVFRGGDGGAPAADVDCRCP